MIVAVCGLIGSGKDTISDYLVNIHQFRRYSFAGSLKDAVSVVFGWDRELLEGRSRESRAWREEVDSWWAERLDIPHLTPRWVLQNWGTEVIRRNFHEDIWVASIENRLRHTNDDVVLSDCRFPNEMSAIKGLGGHVIRVTRGQDPVWFDMAVHNPELMSKFYPNVHVSEWSWASADFSAIVHNDGSLQDLYQKINELVQKLSSTRGVVNDLVQDRRVAKADHF